MYFFSGYSHQAKQQQEKQSHAHGIKAERQTKGSGRHKTQSLDIAVHNQFWLVLNLPQGGDGNTHQRIL